MERRNESKGLAALDNEDTVQCSIENQGNVFQGVRFFLAGFDPSAEIQYATELENNGGFNVGRYDASCTHVIVHGLTYGLKACNSWDWYKSSGAPIPLRLLAFAPSLKKHMSISGGIFLHFNFPFITTRILCYKIMLPSRTNRGVVQDHKRLRAVDSGGNTAWIGSSSSSSSSQPANAGFDSVATNGENEILSDGWKVHSEQILKVSELEADSKLGHEVSPSKTCTHEGFSRKCEDNGSPKVRRMPKYS